MTDKRQQAAIDRMAMRRPEEIELSYEGQINDDPNQRPEYPRLMYRATKVEEKVQQTDANAKCGETWAVVNLYHGKYLCDVREARTLDEAEEMNADGWEISPAAAHGESAGLTEQVSAKDQRIADLEAQLAAREQRRGPGRPPKSSEDKQPENEAA